MVYNQLFFCLFSVLAALVISTRKDARTRQIALGAGNLAFLALLFFWSPRSLLLLLFFLALNFAGLKVLRRTRRAAYTLPASLFVAANLAFLLLANYAGSGSSPLFLVGLSLLVLRLMHLVVETRSSTLKRPLTPLHYLNFTAFFPAYLSGPIARYDDFVRQFESAAPMTAGKAYLSLVRITIGLFKAQVLAFLLTPFSFHTLDGYIVARYPAFAALSLCVFGVWLYLSFSGITDIAIGFGELLGVTLPRNFDRPFVATNLQEFWRRWHISLLDWIRDYLYFPILGWARSLLPGRPFACKALAVLVSFTLLGAWHGPGGNFVRFGLYHGAGMLVFLAYARTIRDRIVAFCSASPWRRGGARALAWAITWAHITLGWVIYLDREKLLYFAWVKP